MRVTRQDLSKDILDKLDQLDKLKVDFNPNVDGYISYSKERGFFIKKAPEATTTTVIQKVEAAPVTVVNKEPKKIYTHSEIENLLKELHDCKNPKGGCNTNCGDFRVNPNKILNDVFYNGKRYVKLSEVVNSENEILFTKFIGNDLYTINIDGLLKKYTMGILSFSFDITKTLKTLFSYDINFKANYIDLDVKNDNIFVSISNQGIYKISQEKNTIEMFASELNIKFIKILYNKLFAVTRDSAIFYSLESGKKTDVSYIFKNLNQAPSLIESNDNYIIVSADPFSFANTDQTIHIWKKNPDGETYKLIDDRVSIRFINTSFKQSKISDIKIFGDRLYVCGIERNYNNADKIFIKITSLKDIETRAAAIETISFSSGDHIRLFNGIIPLANNQFLISGSEKEIFTINKNGKILDTMILDKNINKLFSIDGKIYIQDSTSLNELVIPSKKKEAAIEEFEIFNGEPCNNIDILVEGATKFEKITLYDELGAEIRPSYYAIIDGSAIIKLLNSTTRRIRLKIEVSSTSSIKGIYCKPDKIYYA